MIFHLGSSLKMLYTLSKEQLQNIDPHWYNSTYSNLNLKNIIRQNESSSMPKGQALKFCVKSTTALHVLFECIYAQHSG